ASGCQAEEARNRVLRQAEEDARRIVEEARRKAEEGNAAHVAAPMPGVVASVAVEPGRKVSPGDLLLTIEAMKMETALHAERAGKIKAVHAGAGAQVDAKDLLVEYES
ncbi:MAG: biotin/lipoyl-containing protein, partial [Pseudomonadota bacterium]